MTAATLRMMTSPRSGGKCVSVPGRSRSASSCHRNARPANRIAGQKTASRNFFAAPSKTHQENTTQTIGTHQENYCCGYDFASGCAVAPNSTVPLLQPTTDSNWTFSSDPTRSHHVETDGNGGLKVVYAAGDRSFVYTNKVIFNSIKIHETTHILDALRENNAIANGLPAGLILSAKATYAALSEYGAIERQLAYINRQMQQPTNLTPLEIRQVNWFIIHVENYRATISGGPTVPMPPAPMGD